MTGAAGQQRQWVYRLFGPTTLHLQHELYLWTSLSLLTLSTLQSIYRQALQAGDGVLVLIVSLWLSRHIVLRWLLTNDTSTAKNPTLLGVFMYWITSYVTAGQYMDRPDPQIVARNAGTPTDEVVSLLPSLSYTLHFLRVRILYPFIKLRECLISDKDNHTPTTAAQRRRSSTSTLASTNASWRTSTYFKWITWWRDNGPSIQMMVSVVVAMVMIWDIFITMYPARVTTSGHVGSDQDMDNIQPRGVYQTLIPPSRSQLLLFLARTPVLLTAFWYGRIALPIPDLVAGANVLKSVRAEAHLHGHSTSASGVSIKCVWLMHSTYILVLIFYLV